MHESAAILQQIINEHRAAIRDLTHHLEHARTHGQTTINPQYLKEQINALTAITDHDELLLRDYHDALTSGDDIRAAVTLARIQYAAATAIETKNALTERDT